MEKNERSTRTDTRETGFGEIGYEAGGSFADAGLPSGVYEEDGAKPSGGEEKAENTAPSDTGEEDGDFDLARALLEVREELEAPLPVRPKRPKAEPGIRVKGVFVPYLLMRRALIAAGGAAAVLLIAFAAKNFGGRGVSPATASEASASVSEAAAETAESAEETETAIPEPTAETEPAETEPELGEEEAVFASYNNLGIVTLSEGYMNLRSAPDSVDMTNIIGKLPAHAAADVISEENGWALVSSGGIRGYVSSQYLATGEEARALALPEIKERVVVRTAKLNMRSAPVLSSDNIVGTALSGERYELLSVDAEGVWARIRVDSVEGVSEAYVNVSGGNAEIKKCLNGARRLDLREMVLTQFDTLVVSNTTDYLNIRETPSDGSIDNICGKFPSHAGAELLDTVYSDDGRKWYQIRSGGVTGYVSADYCATGSRARDLALEGAVLTAEITTDALNVRTEPSTDAAIWTQVTKGQEYHVLAQLDGWVQLELDSSDESENEADDDQAYVSTRDNNVDVRYGLPEAFEYYPAVEAANAAAAFRNEIINYACQFVGNPYVWGGTSLTNGADCSGFTMKVLEHFGISIPRVSRDQARSGVQVSSDQMKPGDLVFYANSRGVINHVGMYIGNGQVVNAASRRSGIRIYRWNYRTPVAIRNVIGD